MTPPSSWLRETGVVGVYTCNLTSAVTPLSPHAQVARQLTALAQKGSSFSLNPRDEPFSLNTQGGSRGSVRICHCPSRPSCFLPRSLAPSVMLSSGPAFYPPLSPPWVSIPNMVIHLRLCQCPTLPCPLSSPAAGPLLRAGRE